MTASETKALEALSIEELAKILKMPANQICNDFELFGAPTNTDGTINLFHYTTWLIQEQGNRN